MRRAQEESEVGREILARLIENATLAREQNLPMCQDTGLAVVFVKLGEETRISGGSLTEAISEGVRQGYERGYLRKSVVVSPLDRRNTGDNTPPVLHLDLVPGDGLSIVVAAKGAGSENMSRLKMMTPAEGLDAIKQFVVESVESAGASACPPLVIGVGLGGSFEQCAQVAKEALLRPLDQPNPDPAAAALERELLGPRERHGRRADGRGGTDYRTGGERRDAPVPHRQPAGGRELAVPRGTTFLVHLGLNQAWTRYDLQPLYEKKTCARCARGSRC